MIKGFLSKTTFALISIASMSNGNIYEQDEDTACLILAIKLGRYACTIMEI